jgi:hypothetical protein
MLAYAAKQKRLQRSPVFREQALHQCLFGLGHLEMRWKTVVF